MLIPRQYYVEQLASRLDNGMVKVITGIRRCGKSVLLFELFANYLVESGIPEQNIVKIPLDEDDYAALRDPGKLNAYIKDKTSNSKSKYYIFIDEAQFAISKEEVKNRNAPIRLYGVLNGLLRKHNLDVYITGSNSKFLSTDVLTEFRGRGDEIRIAPLSFSEFYSADTKDKYEALSEYSLYGGLPHIVAERTAEGKAKYLDHLLKEIYLKDICERYNLKDGSGMQELMQVIASAIGSLTNPQKISSTFTSSGYKGISAPTISSYLSILQECFMTKKARRYNVKGRKYISTPSKYYYTDLGIRNAVLGFRQYEETHIMENIIFNELLHRGYLVDVGVVEINISENSKHLKKQLEVDFVANKGNKRYYVQSAFALPDNQKIEQEQASLVNIPDSFKKIIVVGTPSPLWRNEQGITIMSIYDFLLNPNSLDL